MLFIAFHLHAYQPPTQPDSILNKIYNESYDPLIKTLEHDPRIFISLDIAKSLGERLPKKFLLRIKRLYEKSQIELVNIAAYHYLLPLAPQYIISRQLRLNSEFYRENFIGEDPLPGIFPPELACDQSLPYLIKEDGYQWLLADDGPFVFERSYLPISSRAAQDWIPTMGQCGFFPRSRYWSELIAWGLSTEQVDGRHFAKELISGQDRWRQARNSSGDSYIIIAVDFETFGHHLKDGVSRFFIPFFGELNNISQSFSACQVVPLDRIWNHFPKTESYLPAGSWATNAEDFANHIYYPLWSHPQQEFHAVWLAFAKVVFSIKLGEGSSLKDIADKAFYSCTPWHFSKGNKDVARWALPYFEKIIALAPDGDHKSLLKKYFNTMDKLTK